MSLACGSSNSGSDGSGGSSSSGGSTSGNGGSTSGNGGSTSGGGDSPAPGQLCARFAAIQCQGEQSCCSTPGRTMADCLTTQQTACSNSFALDDVAMSPLTGFDMTKSNAAFAQFDSLATKCDTSIGSFGISLNGFRGIVAGTVAPGGTCNPGTTGSRLAAAEIALVSCQDPANNACLPEPTGMDWKCAPRADTAGTCFTTANCKDGLYCDNPQLVPAGGTCKATQASGADCTSNDACTSFACVNGKCADATKDAAYCLNTSSM